MHLDTLRCFGKNCLKVAEVKDSVADGVRGKSESMSYIDTKNSGSPRDWSWITPPIQKMPHSEAGTRTRTWLLSDPILWYRLCTSSNPSSHPLWIDASEGWYIQWKVCIDSQALLFAQRDIRDFRGQLWRQQETSMQLNLQNCYKSNLS